MNTRRVSPAGIDRYIASQPEATRVILEKVRSIIRDAAPDAEETICYQIPTFRYNGNLVHFAAFKKHIGFFPTPSGIAAFKEELSPYKHAKGSVQFPLDQPVPYELIGRIVAFRVKENAEKGLTRFVALLRGVNVGGNNQVPMPALCSLCEELGNRKVQSYIQSGNLVFLAAGVRPTVEAALESGMQRKFGLSIPVVVRTATDWRTYVQSNPFAEASASEPNRVMLALSKKTLTPNVVPKLRERASNGERIHQTGKALWIHFPSGVAKSKLTPSLLDRSAGSPVTMRNWRTVLKLSEMLA
jgi:uncharacterized protein (DUF1697 family)/uncharacterized protein YdhG (YjbR/CyaY superfamily)